MMLFDMIDRVKCLIRVCDVMRKCFVSVYWMMMMYFAVVRRVEKERKEKEKKEKEKRL